MHNKKRVSLCLSSMLLAGLALGGSAAELKEGKPAPDFSLKDLNGKTVRLSAFKGKSPVLLDFFAMW